MSASACLSFALPAVRFTSECLSHSFSVFPFCLSLFFSLVCTYVLSPSVSVCLLSLHWYALLPSTLSLTVHMIILFSRLFFLSLSVSSCLIMALFVYICFSLSSALSVFVAFPSLFLFPCSPTPSFLPQLLLLLLLFTAFTESQREEKEKNKRTERERRESAPFSPPEPNKHLCLFFTTKMVNNNRH